jgi:hypothetical protein
MRIDYLLHFYYAFIAFKVGGKWKYRGPAGNGNLHRSFHELSGVTKKADFTRFPEAVTQIKVSGKASITSSQRPDNLNGLVHATSYHLYFFQVVWKVFALLPLTPKDVEFSRVIRLFSNLQQCVNEIAHVNR